MADSRVARLRLIRTPTIGPVTYRQLIARFGSADAAINALPDLAARGGGRAPKVAEASIIEREIAAAEKHGARYLFVDDPDYPPLLAELDNAPAAMTIRGDTGLFDRTSVAIVGARNASAAACRFARGLAGSRSSWGAKAWSSCRGWRAGWIPPRIRARWLPARSA